MSGLPEPVELAAIIDDAERIVERWNGPLMRRPRLERRRELARAVMEELRRQRQDGAAEQVPMPL